MPPYGFAKIIDLFAVLPPTVAGRQARRKGLRDNMVVEEMHVASSKVWKALLFRRPRNLNCLALAILLRKPLKLKIQKNIYE